MKTRTPYERMVARTAKCGNCLVFTGARDRNGHGVVRVKVDGQWTTRKAHQVSYAHHKGRVPPGMVIRHTCDVATCVNPAHLILGSQAENVRDMIMRDRARNQYGPYTGYVENSDVIPF